MPRRRMWLLNRVVLGLIAFFTLAALWEFKWKPQYRGFYEDGVRLYKSGQYLRALDAFNTAYGIAPNAVDVIIMQGWTNLKLNRLEEARYYFDRAIRIDPRTEEAQIGMSFVALETGRGEMDPALLSRILKGRKNDPNVMILVAGAEERQADYFQASQIYSQLLSDKDYGQAARFAMDNIFGLRGFNDAPPSAFPPLQRPSELQVRARAADGALQKRSASGNWTSSYVQGVDLGAAPPGYRPTSLPNDGALYSEWLKDATQLHADTLRVYTLLPPAFYRAFHHYVGGGGELSLMQQIWVATPEHQDLFEPGFVEETRGDIRNVVDAIHGRGSVPAKRTRGSGVYEFDIADRVSGFLLGRELEPDVVSRTNVLNAANRSYQGKYLSVSNASATEAWLVEMGDYLIDYETSTYNWQHPVALISGASPDPATTLPLETKIKQQPAYVAGAFAAYPAFAFFPDYMAKNPRYANARDNQGVNPVSGFVRDLHTKLPVPLIVSEYGASTSIEPRLALSNGWNQGGYSERRQAEALTRLGRTVRENGAAGGLLFELTDEWYRYGWLTQGFQASEERASVWLNEMDPAKRYGLIGYRTSKADLFHGDPAEWEKEKKLYANGPDPRIGDGYDGERTLRSVGIAADEGYLYLRLQVACLDCVRSAHTGKTHFDQAIYAVALNTLPGSAGISKLPFGDVNVPGGANFLLVLRQPEQTRMLLADSYNPFQLVARSDDPRRKQLAYKKEFTPSLAAAGEFQEAGPDHGLSELTYAQGNPAAGDYDTTAEWYADIKRSAVVVRIPWGKLLVTDPSNLMALAGYDSKFGVRSWPTSGVQASVYVLRPKAASDLRNMSVAVALPSNGSPEKFAWPRWSTVKLDPYRKQAFTAVEQEYGQPRGPAATGEATAAGKKRRAH